VLTHSDLIHPALPQRSLLLLQAISILMLVNICFLAFSKLVNPAGFIFLYFVQYGFYF
jgi:hypothetical protein